MLETRGGQLVYAHDDIEKEIVDFYTNLVGTSSQISQDVNIAVLRGGASLTREQAMQLIQPVTEAEVWKAISDIGVNKAPGLDGYSSLFYKVCWPIIKMDVMAVVQEFFEKKSTSSCT